MSKEEKLVTIATFEDSAGADFAKQMLEEHGIHAAVVGENFSNMYPIAPLAKIELQVLESHAEKARKIIEPSDREIS